MSGIFVLCGRPGAGLALAWWHWGRPRQIVDQQDTVDVHSVPEVCRSAETWTGAEYLTTRCVCEIRVRDAHRRPACLQTRAGGPLKAHFSPCEVVELEVDLLCNCLDGQDTCECSSSGPALAHLPD